MRGEKERERREGERKGREGERERGRKGILGLVQEKDPKIKMWMLRMHKIASIFRPLTRLQQSICNLAEKCER